VEFLERRQLHGPAAGRRGHRQLAAGAAHQQCDLGRAQQLRQPLRQVTRIAGLIKISGADIRELDHCRR
jgi:hypothetical protein